MQIEEARRRIITGKVEEFSFGVEKGKGASAVLFLLGASGSDSGGNKSAAPAATGEMGLEAGLILIGEFLGEVEYDLVQSGAAGRLRAARQESGHTFGYTLSQAEACRSRTCARRKWPLLHLGLLFGTEISLQDPVEFVTFLRHDRPPSIRGHNTAVYYARKVSSMPF